MNTQFAIIYSEFNRTITEELFRGAKSRLLEKGALDENITVLKVPGAIEIPLIAKLCAQKNKFSAIICLGAVIRGETNHYDYVCEQVSLGCQKVMLDFNVPVIFGVLTTENLEQAEARSGGHKGHKGIEATDAALQMVKLIADIDSF